MGYFSSLNIKSYFIYDILNSLFSTTTRGAGIDNDNKLSI